MGREFYQKGANVQLGPGACLVRASTTTPLYIGENSMHHDVPAVTNHNSV